MNAKELGDRLAYPYFGDAGVHEGGLLKRELFAAMAMQGLLANGKLADYVHGHERRAEIATKSADALLAQLAATGAQP